MQIYGGKCFKINWDLFDNETNLSKVKRYGPRHQMYYYKEFTSLRTNKASNIQLNHPIKK
jgi:hypothetical protein